MKTTPLLIAVAAAALSLGCTSNHEPLTNLNAADPVNSSSFVESLDSGSTAEAIDTSSSSDTSAASTPESGDAFDFAGVTAADSPPFVSPSTQMLSRYYR